MSSHTEIAQPIGADIAAGRARQAIYQFLSKAFADPKAEGWERVLNREYQELTLAAVEFVRSNPPSEAGELALGELALDRLELDSAISFTAQSREDFIAEYDAVFGLLISKECPPNEIEYCPQTFTVTRMQHLADIAGFYRAFGLEPSSNHPERQDHLVLELEFMAWLVAKELYAQQEGLEEQAQICREAQKKFTENHLAWWTPAFAFALRKKMDGLADESELDLPAKSFYSAAAACLSAFIATERHRLGVPPPTELLPPNPSDEESESCHGCSGDSM